MMKIKLIVPSLMIVLCMTGCSNSILFSQPVNHFEEPEEVIVYDRPVEDKTNG